ncbi:MAG: Ig-like domain-containing protein [Treponema sp.]|nr:Ig-like domain-containing protein [Treponema sp.]
MKKFTNFLLTIAATLAFVMSSCSGGTNIASAFSSSQADINNDLATLGIIADSYTNSNPDVLDVELTNEKVKLTSKSAGNSLVTLMGSSSSDISYDASVLVAKLDVTVSSAGKISYNLTRPDGSTTTGGNTPATPGAGGETPSAGPSSPTESGSSQQAPSEATVSNAAVKIVKSEGYLNSGYIVFEQIDNKEYTVLCDGVEIDEQLIRYYDTYKYNTYDETIGWTEHSFTNVVRADALGLTAGNHTMSVAVKGSTEYSKAEMKVLSHDRSGFAFTGSTTPGAYNADGTLKSGAVVIYLTQENKGRVQATFGGKTYTGIKEITQAIKKKNTGNTAIDIRIVGKVTAQNNDLSCADLSSAYAIGVKEGSQVTIEGVGHDATLFAAGVAAFKSEYIEIANLGLMKWGGGHDGDGVSLKEDSYAWVHHCDFFYGDAGSDKDQVKGDGSMDMKDDSNHITVAYNHFWDSGKMSLCGMKSESGPNYITYHHNWFDHSDSRHPRIRTMTVHVYNNYFDGNSKYGVGVTSGASCFVEGNYFRNAHDPMMSSMQGTDAQGDGTFSSEDGGVIKSYNNKFAESNTNGVKFQFITNKYDYTNNQPVGTAVTKTETVGTDNGDGTWTIYDAKVTSADGNVINTIGTCGFISVDSGATFKADKYQVSKGKTGFKIKVPANVTKVIVKAKCGSKDQTGTANMLKVNGTSVSMDMSADYNDYEVPVSVSSDSTIEIANAHSSNAMNVRGIKVIASGGWSTTYTSGSSVSLDDIDAYEVDSRSETVPDTVTAKAGGSKYSNFDTVMGNSGLGLSNLPTGPEAAKTDVLIFAGRYESDFAWSFNNSADDASYSVNTPLNSAIVSHRTGFVKIQGTTAGGTQVSGGDTPSTPSNPSTPSEPSTPSTPAVNSISLNQTSVNLKVGETFTLVATVDPADATVTWKTSKKAFATVSDGVVTALSAGTTKITATAGEKTASCTVTVTENTSSSGGTSGSTTPAPEGAITFNNFTSGVESNGIKINGNLKSGVAAKTYDGVTYTTALKMESATSIEFSLDAASTITIITDNTASKGIKIDGTKETTNADGVVTKSLASGSHKITKGDSMNVYAVIITAN